jgi:hypothetical protein
LTTADQLRQDIGRISASRPDGMPTSTLAAALAAEGWEKAGALLDQLEERVNRDIETFNPDSRAAALVADLNALLAAR